MPNYENVNGAWPADCTIPPITRHEAERAQVKLIRKFGKAKDRSVRLAAGSRDLRLGRVRTCWIATGKSGPTDGLRRGRRRLVHDVSHRVHRYRYPGKNPHGSFHAAIEADMIRYVLAHGWLTGKLRAAAEVKPSLGERRAARLAHTRALIAKWEARAKRAQSRLHSLRATERRQAKGAVEAGGRMSKQPEQGLAGEVMQGQP